ncbi:MAG: glycine cleavage system protein GcvH [Chloroflexi bacterium]|nr:glycine cleavage system protein GcvH [Chloroflexota bacterium]
MDVPDDLRYSDDHEWLRTDGADGLVGITRYAADELGDVVFVELPAVGRTLARGETFGVIESVKTASDLYSPISGEVLEVNDALGASPELVNEDPYGQGWIVRLRLADPSEAELLRDAAGYRSLIGD